MTAVIAGAGVCGLATAHALAASGVSVDVFERGRALLREGSAVTLWGGGTGILESLGVPVTDLGVRLETMERWTPSGDKVLSIDLTRSEKRFGSPAISVTRAELIDALSAGLPVGTVHFGSACTDAADLGTRARLNLDDGSVHTGDFLIGADGVHSAVRAAIRGDTAREMGWTTWQGLTPVDCSVTNGTSGVMVVGPEGMCGMNPAGNGLLQWWFDVPGSSDDDGVETIHRAFGSWECDDVQKVLAAAHSSDMQPFVHLRHTVHKRWGRGRITLAGDAAHAWPPSLAQGANQALEDAWVLGRVVGRATTDLETIAALRDYEDERYRRAALVSALSGAEVTKKPAPGVFLKSLPDGLLSSQNAQLTKFVSNYLSSR
ncbi:FAD-dependent oxidoreductase [Spelaeicoccus albus]